MNPEHKKYILENIGRKSARNIAGDLHLKEKVVKRFLESEGVVKIAGERPDASVNLIDKKQLLIFSAILIAVVVAVYANALKCGFIFDDYEQVLNNPYIRSWGHLPVILGSGFARIDITGTNYYRPLLEISYLIDHNLWGFWPVGYHITNILFHVFNAVILLFLITRLFQNIKISFLTALIFCVHPIYTSAVTYVSGRADSMVITFILLSFLFYLKYIGSGKSSIGILIASSVCFLLALLTKEIAVYFILIIFLYRLYLPPHSKERSDRSKWYAGYSALSAALVIYILMRSNAVKSFFTTSYNVAASAPATERLLTAIRAFFDYLTLLILPVGLHFERTVPLASSVFDPRVLLALGTMALSVYMIISLRGKKGAIFCGIAWYLLMFIPISNIIIPLNAFIAENWIQLPALGLFLVVGALAAGGMGSRGDDSLSIKLLRKSPMVLFICAVVAYATLTIVRNSEYGDPVVFYENALKYEPKNLKLINNLGVEIHKRGDTKTATTIFKSALDIDPNHVTSLNNLANVYNEQGRYDDAIVLYERALLANKSNINCLNNLGVAYIRKGDKVNALYHWRKSLELNPNQPVIVEYVKLNS